MIVGSAFFDYSTNEPIENPNMGVYVWLLIVNLMITLVILALYLWKYEQDHPILDDNWLLDAIILGVILCGMNFLLDAMFFGMMGRDLLAYFFLFV